jgi:hypothetical protein
MNNFKLLAAASACLVTSVASAQISYASQYRRVLAGSQNVLAPGFDPFQAVAQNLIPQGPGSFRLVGEARQTSSLQPAAISFNTSAQGGANSNMTIEFDLPPGATLTLAGTAEQVGGPSSPLATAHITIDGPDIAYSSPDSTFPNLNHTLTLSHSQVLAGGRYTFALVAVGGSGSTAGNFTMTTGSAVGQVTIAPPCRADIGGAGGIPGVDLQLDNNDFIVFVSWFFQQDVRADFGTIGGNAGADGDFDNNDFIAFIDAFFNGCS